MPTYRITNLTNSKLALPAPLSAIILPPRRAVNFPNIVSSALESNEAWRQLISRRAVQVSQVDSTATEDDALEQASIGYVKGVIEDLPGGGAGGDVTGPETSADNEIPIFDGTDGDTLQKSNIIVDPADVSMVLRGVTVNNVGGDNLWILKGGTLDNIETPPINIVHGARVIPPPMGASADSAGFYSKIDPGEGDNKYSFIIDVTDGQVDTSSGAFKIVSYGAGDAGYFAMFGNGGVAIECAAFSNTSKGIISTFQTIPTGGALGDAGAQDFNSAVGFNVVNGWDGTGGSYTKTAFGLYFADRSLGHSLHTRTQDPEQPGFVDGTSEWVITNWAGRDRFQVLNNGSMIGIADAATAETQFQNAPFWFQRAAYWDGAASQDRDAYFQHTIIGTTWSQWRFVIANGLVMMLDNNNGTLSVDLQNNRLIAVGNLALQRGDSSGDPGAATLNTPAGLSSFALGESSVTVTNSLVTTASIVLAVLQEEDDTLTHVLRVVPAAGSFEIVGNAAATAATKVGWTIIN